MTGRTIWRPTGSYVDCTPGMRLRRATPGRKGHLPPVRMTNLAVRVSQRGNLSFTAQRDDRSGLDDRVLVRRCALLHRGPRRRGPVYLREPIAERTVHQQGDARRVICP